jgi:hypothetical protein
MKRKPTFLIVGGGYYGCFTTWKLKQSGFKVCLIEKNKEILGNASTHNQNRLHLGYHYMRNKSTRNECQKGFPKFLEHFETSTIEIPHNIYIIHKESLLDFKTIESILKYEEIDFKSLENLETLPFQLMSEKIENVLLTKERLINHKKVEDFFLKNIRENILLNTDYDTWVVDIIDKGVQQKKLLSTEEVFDYTIFCTFNQKVPCKLDCRVENCLTLVYELLPSEKIENNFALTVIDGPFWSLFPWHDNLFTLTHVKHTVLPEDNKFSLEEKKKSMEQDVRTIFPDFIQTFKYHSYFISNKVKPLNSVSDDRSVRYLRIDRQSLYISGGKITGIFDIPSILEEQFNIKIDEEFKDENFERK